MVLPKYLQSSYTRYKDDTNSFATWLLEAATKCGHRPDGLVSVSPSLKKNKGKGRSKPKSKADGANASTEPFQYNATIKELQMLAEVIAKSTLVVPKQILVIAKRAIKLRRQVTSWFLGQGDSENNKRHEHFISALEKVCETLEWKICESANKDARKPPAEGHYDEDDADLDMFLNRFAVLTVEEPQESEPSQHASPESQQIVKVELVEDEEEEQDATEAGLAYMFFKTLCLFRDLHNMRAFISQTWSEYRDKKIDLMNAAVVTDGALQLACDLVQELMDDYDNYGTPSDSLQRVVFNASCMSRGIMPTPSVEIGLPYNKDMTDVAEWCYFPTMVLLNSFADVLHQNDLPVFKKGYFGNYDPRANREKMSVGQKFNEDKIILLQLLPEFCILGYDIQLPASDVLTRGLVEFCKTKKVTPWLCFASQILLDVHHLMRHSRLGAFQDLRMSGLRIQKTIEEYLKISESHPQPKFWPKEGDEEIKDLHSTVESCIIEDPIYMVKVNVFPKSHIPEKHALLSQHAILCGVNMFHINMRMQSVGQQLVTQWYDVQQLAFLYNLVKQAPMHAHMSWPDMETFIKIHGESHIFIGSRPKNASESLNRLELATGISSATKFARDSRNRNDFHRPNGKNPRILEPTTTVANLFRGQYVVGLRKEDEGIQNIDKVLNTLSQAPRLETTSKNVRLTDPQEVLQRKWAHTHRIGTIQLLALVKSRLFEEEPVILFNYFGMHKRSLELLREIKAKEHHKFVQYFTPDYMPDESFISNIVILVHHVARGSAQNAKSLGMVPKEAGSQIISRIVVSCGDIMQAYLQKNGDVACKELKIFCKNKTPIQEEAKDDGGRSGKFMSWVNFEDVVGPQVITSLMTGVPLSN
ncbi:hypothetical protein N7494_007686 [Penicillium frequentans]|uniref:DUF6604 domain-containing protein n=1 Tax=Penicillium frequentans TaxID=3151616 RepID=A0AAD6CUJ3_9EURO|nr:hypothetical protein N7494_007686 [Penicillium glabrum]